MKKSLFEEKKKIKNGGDYESETSPLKWSGEARQVERRRRKEATIFRKFILKKKKKSYLDFTRCKEIHSGKNNIQNFSFISCINFHFEELLTICVYK